MGKKLPQLFSRQLSKEEERQERTTPGKEEAFRKGNILLIKGESIGVKFVLVLRLSGHREGLRGLWSSAIVTRK